MHFWFDLFSCYSFLFIFIFLKFLIYLQDVSLTDIHVIYEGINGFHKH